MPRITKQGSSFNGHRMVGSERPASYRTSCADQKFVQSVGADGLTVTPVQCGKCKHCRWVRRQAMANSVEMELRDSDWSLWVTLTIAPGPRRAVDNYDKVLDKRLMQNFQKVCLIHRDRQTHSFKGRVNTSWRYIQCGEYGERKGRAHYHAVIFGKGSQPDWLENPAYLLPPIPGQKQRYMIPEWSWGHVTIDTVVDGGVAFYLSKYMQKGGAKQSWASASNRRAIGSTFARFWGEMVAKHGFAVPTLDWKLTMNKRKALVRGSKRRDLLLAFCEAKGVSVLSLAKLLPRVMLPSIVKIERERREKLAGGKVLFFARERIKAEVWAECRAVLGLVDSREVREGRPLRPKDWQPCYSFRKAAYGQEQSNGSEGAADAAASFLKSAAARAARAVSDVATNLADLATGGDGQRGAVHAV